MIRRTAVLLFVALGAYPAGVESQTVVRITEADDACRACRIDLERVVTLHPPSDQVLFVVLPGPNIARDRAGRYLAGVMVGEAPVAVFEPSGSLTRVFGRFGQGPGELSDSRAFVQIGAGDTVHVFQDIRHLVLSPGAQELVLSRQIQVRPFAVVLRNGTTIVAAAVRGPGGGGTPVQVLAKDGKVARGIGVVNAQGGNPFVWARRIAQANRRDAVWSAYYDRYQMSRFGLDGREETRVIREAEWFPPRSEYISGEGYRTRARPTVEGLVEPNEDTLWVAISRGDPAYEPRDLPPGVEGEPLDPYQDDNGRLNTVLEVLDVRSGRVLGHTEFDPYLRFVSTPDQEPLLYSMRTLETGDVVVDIWRARLRTGGQ